MKRLNNRALSTYKIKKIIFHFQGNIFASQKALRLFCLRCKCFVDKQIIRHKSQYNKQVFYDF